MLLWILFSTLFFIKLMQILWERRKFYALSSKLPGALALPIIGNGLLFNCKQEELFYKCIHYVNKYKSPCKIWLGPKLAVGFTEPENIEKIMTSSKLSQKHDLYKFMYPVFGTGLITGNGLKYKIHKRLVQQFINLDLVEQNFGILHKNFGIMIKSLEKNEGSEIFDIKDKLHYCFVDILSNLILGWNVNAQFGKNREFINAIVKVQGCIYERMLKPWLYPDFLFQYSNNKKTLYKNVECIHEIYDKLIEKIETKTVDEIGNANFKSIFEELYEIMDYDKFNKNDLKYHATTFYLAGEDTVTLITSFACVCFAIEKEYQQKAYEEIQSVFNGNVENATLADLNKLKYLEMCIKDVLRLFPVVPFILRKILYDTKIGDFTYPAGCAIVVAIYNIHRSGEYWLKPNKFYPDHFLPEVADKRPNYTYLPFSSGPRMCIGKPWAYASLKLAMSYILQNYELDCDYKTLDDFKISADIVIRDLNGCKVRIKRRA